MSWGRTHTAYRRHLYVPAAFVEDVFRRYRGHFGAKRQSGARTMRCADWGELRTLHDWRREAVCRC